MNPPYETYERNGLTVEIYPDDDPEDPREWDNLGTMICVHGRYNLGHEQLKEDDLESWGDLKNHLFENRDAAIALPLGLYDHSGISMYIGDQHDKWDGGQVGFIYISRQEIIDQYGKFTQETIDKAEECLRGEVEAYNQYLTGDVWGYVITNPKDGEEVGACWGFYGLDDCKQIADAIADDFVHPHDAAYAKNAKEMHG